MELLKTSGLILFLISVLGLIVSIFMISRNSFHYFLHAIPGILLFIYYSFSYFIIWLLSKAQQPSEVLIIIMSFVLIVPLCFIFLFFGEFMHSIQNTTPLKWN